MKTFKAGVVGTGFIGVAHVEALRRLGNVEVLAITDSQSPEIKAKTMNIPNSFTDYKKMIDINYDWLKLELSKERSN